MYCASAPVTPSGSVIAVRSICVPSIVVAVLVAVVVFCVSSVLASAVFCVSSALASSAFASVALVSVALVSSAFASLLSAESAAAAVTRSERIYPVLPLTFTLYHNVPASSFASSTIVTSVPLTALPRTFDDEPALSLIFADAGTTVAFVSVYAADDIDGMTDKAIAVISAAAVILNKPFFFMCTLSETNDTCVSS